MKNNLLKTLLQEFGVLFEPVAAAAESDLSRRLLFENTGWNLEAESDLPFEELIDRLNQLVVFYERLVNLVENPPETFAEVQEALDVARELFSAIRLLHTFKDESKLDLPQFHELGQDLVTVLITDYLETWQPALHDLLVLLTIIRSSVNAQSQDPILDATGNLSWRPRPRSELQFERIHDLLSDPYGLLTAEYLSSNGLGTAEDGKASADKLFPRLAAFLGNFGVDVVYGIKTIYGLDFGEIGNELGAEMLTAFRDSDLEEDIGFGCTLALSSRDRGNLGLVVIPFGELTFSRIMGEWELTLELTAGVEAFAVGSDGLTLLAGPDTTSVSIVLSAINLPEFENIAFVIGSKTGTRLEVGQFLIKGEANLDTSNQDYGLTVEVGSAALVVERGDGDGLIQKLLPESPARVNFDLTLGFSKEKGFYIRGSAALDYTLIVNKQFGSFHINTIHISLDLGQEQLVIIGAATGTAQIGPVTAAIQELGLETAIEFGTPGALGTADLSLSFKPPTGIGLSIDAQGIKGGGFLEIDPPNYGGVLELTFQDEIDLTAFGLITTGLPDGKPGFSLVISVLAQFEPIQLGLGFALTGVGGLIAINRQMNEEALREMVKNHSLDAILFPSEPIKDATKIIELIKTILPPKEGFHVFGPMAQLIWGGSVTLVEFDVGIFIEIGGPVRIALLGQARSELPDRKSPLVVLNMDVLGVIDLGNETVAIDSALFNSRLLHFSLTGDMAMRANFGEDADFALAVGGFHPRYEPPPGFPALKRLVITLGDGNPRISIAAYMAITTNTLQFGALADLRARKRGFTVAGSLGFDALFIFNPFSFEVSVEAWMDVLKGGRVLLGASLSLIFSGPNPFRARGYAKIKICWFIKIKVRFDKTFGKPVPQVIEAASPLAVLVDALKDERNYHFELPTWASATLVFVEGAEHRLDRTGLLVFSQNAVPLNLKMQRFAGTAPPQGEDRLAVQVAGKNTAPALASTAVKDRFAPEQFYDWSAEQRLAARPFETFESGVRLTSEYSSPPRETIKTEFETFVRESEVYVDSRPEGDSRKHGTRLAGTWAPSAAKRVNWSLAGTQQYYRPLRKRRDPAKPGLVEVVEPRFAATGHDSPDEVSVLAGGDYAAAATFAEALESTRGRHGGDLFVRSVASVAGELV